MSLASTCNTNDESVAIAEVTIELNYLQAVGAEDIRSVVQAFMLQSLAQGRLNGRDITPVGDCVAIKHVDARTEVGSRVKVDVYLDYTELFDYEDLYGLVSPLLTSAAKVGSLDVNGVRCSVGRVFTNWISFDQWLDHSAFIRARCEPGQVQNNTTAEA